MKALTVRGRVSVGGDELRVHGLTVEAWDDGPCEPVCLGQDLAAADGAYRIGFCPPEDGCPVRVFIRIRDRDGRLLHDGRTDGCACLPAAPAIIDVVLAPETLWWHSSRSISWTRPEGPLVDPNILDDVHDAFEQLWPGQVGPDLGRDLPPIHAFEDLLDDAWGSLQGDLDAGRRFRGVLDLLCGSSTGSCDRSDDALAAAVANIFARDCPPEQPCGEPKPEPARAKCGAACGCGCDHQTDAECPCKPATAVALDHVAVLAMAVLHVACGHEPTAIRHLTALLDQLCRLDHLATLHTAVTRALCGDEADRRHVRELLTFYRRRTGTGGCGRCGTGGLACCSTCLDRRVADCLADAVCAWRSIECFRVTDITPSRACPGDTVVICGSGFGDVPGDVEFRRSNSLELEPRGQVTSWCCDSISVVVPSGAGCGLTLTLPADTVEVCGRFLEYRPFGCFEVDFEGTSPEILKFAVAGRSEGDCVEPGTPLDISWVACATDRVRVQVIDEETGAELDSLDPAPERGRWRFDGSGFTTTTRVQVRIRAEGICSPPVVERTLSLIYQARPDLSVDGMEVTQAIQHYRADQHLTDTADRGPDNSLQLVTDKTAWVRVYLRSGQDPTFDGGRLDGIDGTLTVERRIGGVWGTVAVLASQNGPVDAQDSFLNYTAERGNIDSSLNFVVPAAIMTGLLRFTARVASPYACPGNQASSTVTVDVNLQQTLSAAFITIGYDGPDNAGTGTLALAPPTLATCQQEVSWALTTFPIGDATVRIAGTFTTNTPLNDPIPMNGGCSPNWLPLLNQVDALSDLDAAANPGWVYYGIIASGIPRNNSGCNWTASGGVSGLPVTYAHEIGHQFQLPHARCGSVGTGNAGYPIYEPYDLPVDVPANPVNSTNWTMASIGEFGLDINNGAIADPSVTEDFMSYCQPRWISRFTHNYLVNDNRLDPVNIPTGSGAVGTRAIVDADESFVAPRGDMVEPLITLSGALEPDGSFEAHSVLRLETRYQVRAGRRSGFRAQLIGADGEVVTEDIVYLSSSVGSCGCPDSSCRDGCDQPEPLLFKAFLRDVTDGSALRIVKGDETVWERPCPDQPPKLSRARATVTKEGRLRVRWTCESSGEVEQAAVRWSDDGGENWNALTAGVTGRSVELGLDGLPSGQVQFQVLVSDGFHTVSAVTAALELPQRPLSVVILYPDDSDRVYLERQVHLRGSAAGNRGTVDDSAFVWSIDGDEVGRGRDIWVDNPGVGTHTLELTVEASNGQAGSATTTFAVPEPESPIS